MTKLTLLQLFNLGGIFMWPLLVFSIASIALIIERTLFFLFHNLKVSDVEKSVLKSLENKNLKEAMDYCEKKPKSKIGAKIILEGLKMAKLGEHRMEKAIESEANEKINSLENGFNLLTALASLSPLTGFLGTVSGMIS
ncbi:MAG TPA: MotA/TolQ/ExbB proton channel family protein, partial [Spirochaetota bacterium]|nr:MotA/TolQ/ExbB proton channel family protein [Spirochaetota bacterium]